MEEAVQPAEETVTTEQVDPLDTPELNKATYDFMHLMPKIKGYAKTMNGKGVARVFSAVMEFPLAKDYPTFKNDAEKELFMFCIHALAAKQTLLSVLANDQEVQKEIVNEVVSTITEEQKEIANGQ